MSVDVSAPYAVMVRSDSLRAAYMLPVQAR